jgi:hypothetical protein
MGAETRGTRVTIDAETGFRCRRVGAMCRSSVPAIELGWNTVAFLTLTRPLAFRLPTTQMHPRRAPFRPFHTDERGILKLPQPASLCVPADAQLGEETAWQRDRRLSRELCLVMDGQQQGERLPWQPRCYCYIAYEYWSFEKSSTATHLNFAECRCFDLNLFYTSRSGDNTIITRYIIRCTGVATTRHRHRVGATVLPRGRNCSRV